MGNLTVEDLILLILGYDIESDEKGNTEYKDLIKILTRYINELSEVDEKSQLNTEPDSELSLMLDKISSFKNIKSDKITEILEKITEFNKKKPDCIGGNNLSNSDKTHGGKKINKRTKKRKTKKQNKLKKKSKKR